MAFAKPGMGLDKQARAKELSQLLGIDEAETADETLAGRLRVIAKLRAAREVEIARGRSGSWLYDLNRHLNLCAALRREYASFAFFVAETAADNTLKPQAIPEKAETSSNVVPFTRVSA
jgi:hypothetical protein